MELLHSPARLPRAAGSLGLQSEQVVFNNHRPENSLGQIMAFGFKQLCGFPRPRLPFGPSVLLVRASPLVHLKLHWERPPLRRKCDHQILTGERLYSQEEAPRTPFPPFRGLFPAEWHLKPPPCCRIELSQGGRPREGAWARLRCWRRVKPVASLPSPLSPPVLPPRLSPPTQVSLYNSSLPLNWSHRSPAAARTGSVH